MRAMSVPIPKLNNDDDDEAWFNTRNDVGDNCHQSKVVLEVEWDPPADAEKIFEANAWIWITSHIMSLEKTPGKSSA